MGWNEEMIAKRFREPKIINGYIIILRTTGAGYLFPKDIGLQNPSTVKNVK